MSLIRFSLIFISLVLCDYTKAQTSGTVVYGYKQYTEFHYGNINIIISAPHDGNLSPNDITTRTTDPLGNLIGDNNTYIIASTISDELTNLFQKNQGISVQPFFIANKLLRNKMDPNRDNTSACANFNEDCGNAYRDYHGMIVNNFVNGFLLPSKYEQGILLDIHGQGHPENWVELGYGLSDDQLNNNNPLTSKLVSSSFISKLVSVSQQSFDNLIRSPSNSLGGIMQSSFNYKVVPSPNYPSPGPNTNYYDGGFISETYGNPAYRLNAIQMELPKTIRVQATIAQVQQDARNIANCIYQFYVQNSLGANRSS